MTTINMTCRNCEKPFKRRTRKGSRTQCPHCGEWQNGPAGLEAQRQQLAEHHQKKAEKNQRDAQRRAPAQKKATPPKGPRKVDSPPEESPSSEPAKQPVAAGGTTEVGKIPTPPERKEPEERHAGWIF